MMYTFSNMLGGQAGDKHVQEDGKLFLQHDVFGIGEFNVMQFGDHL